MIKSRLAELKKRYGVGSSNNNNESATQSGSKGGYNTSATSDRQQSYQQTYLDSLQENLAKKLQNIKQKASEEEEEQEPTRYNNNFSKTPQKSDNAPVQKDVISMTDYKSRLRQEMLAKKKQTEDEYVDTAGGKKVKSALADRVSNLEKTLQGNSGRTPEVSNFYNEDFITGQVSQFIDDRPSQQQNKKKQTRRNEDF
jgi:arginine utilization protein RocB